MTTTHLGRADGSACGDFDALQDCLSFDKEYAVSCPKCVAILAARPSTWLGPFVFDDTTYFVHRHGPNSAPHTLPVPASRRWDLLEADFDDPSRPRPNSQCAMVVRPNAEDDATALRRLLGERVPVVFKPGWGPDGGLPVGRTP